jgi:carbonic anhydrase/acetyltransferase-like protein (isoleucine patch superfamily)
MQHTTRSKGSAPPVNAKGTQNKIAIFGLDRFHLHRLHLLWLYLRGRGCYGCLVHPIDPQIQHQLDTYLRKQPVLGQGVYLAKTAVVFGDVTLGDHSSVWYNAVLRGDIQRIVIGHHTNIQDNAVVHLADEFPCLIGDWVTVGHSAIVHACTVGDECLVGIGAVVLDGAVIGRQCLIDAKALVTPGTIIPGGSLVLGSPAKVTRALTDQERGSLRLWAEKYVHNAAYCLRHSLHVGAPL